LNKGIQTTGQPKTKKNEKTNRKEGIEGFSRKNKSGKWVYQEIYGGRRNDPVKNRLGD